MPRAEDIAWKFVVRLQGKKWRCPYCKNEYSGSVARVKSHFLKHRKEGIASCTKVPEHICTLMELLLNNEVCNKDDIAWKFVNRLEVNKWRCYHCMEEFFGDLTGVKGHLLKVSNEGISMCTEVPDHITMLMKSLLDELAEEEGREANGPYSLEPSFDRPNDVLRLVSPASSKIVRSSSPIPLVDTPSFTQQEANRISLEPSFDRPNDVLHLVSPARSKIVRLSSPIPLVDTSSFTQQDIIGLNAGQQSQAKRSFPQSSNTLSWVRHSNGETLSHSTTTLAEEIHSVGRPAQAHCPVRPPTPEETQTNDQLPAVGNSRCLLDCNQHSQSQTPMDIDFSTSQHPVIQATIVDKQVPEAATNTTGPSSSQDLNRGSVIKDVRSIDANDEEIRKLKRKVEELDDKEAVIKEQIEMESAASLVWKKPRRSVVRWLKETERARKTFQIICQAPAETFPPKEQVETLKREVAELIGEPLPQTLLIEEIKFLERKLRGEAIHGNIELIWDRLMKNNACKLGICGMGGVGKTTIMMHVHNRLLEDATFNVAFITVSRDFSIYKLQSDIGKALDFGVKEDEHENKRAAKLSKQLERKKNCVLILDDVWRHLELEEVGIPVRADGLKLVLTTRSIDVCHQMQCQEIIKIKPLSQEDAESLFLEELGSEVTSNLKIKAIVKSIVRECAGLPIGVITMARSMRGVTDEFEWRESLVKLEESSMGQTDMEKVLMNLKYSYDCLGRPDIQQCFLSCALYPEDEWIDKFELIEFFIDQGLIGGLHTREEQYDRGFTILNKLRNVCLLEDDGSKMKMHDLIRDMALHIMGATCIVKAGKNLRRIPSEEYWTDALEKVSLMQNHFREFPLNMSPSCPKLSTLLLNQCLLSSMAIPDFFFKNLLGLKVLNLSGNHVTELPNSISDLVNLRALLLRECSKLRRIPYLGNLTSLRKLDARGCESLKTVEGVEKLVNLRYLDLAKTYIVLKGISEHLLNLQCLRVWSVIHVEDADNFNECVRVIGQSDNPRFYELKVGPRLSEYSKDPKDSEYLEFNMEVSDAARFGELERRVDMGEWGHAIVSMGAKCTGRFILIPRDMQTMRMTKCNGMRNLSGMGLLENLESLDIYRCENLQVLCGGQDEEVNDIHDSPAPTPTPFAFPNLRDLIISYCPKLKYLFGHGFKFNLPHLRQIRVSYCEEMVGITPEVTPLTHPLPAFPSLERIYILRCDKMKRAVEPEWEPHFPKLEEWKVDNRGPPVYRYAAV